AVLPCDADRFVQQLADLEAPRMERLLQRRRVDLVLGALAPRQQLGVCRDTGLELGERRAGEHLDMPGLEIAAGRRARSAIENVANRGKRNGGRKERPARIPGRDRVAYIHENRSPLLGSACGVA